MLPVSKSTKKPIATPDRRRVDPAINGYAQHRLSKWLKDNPGQLATNFAEQNGLSDYAVSTLKNKGEGVGWHIARQLARAFGLTLAEYMGEADGFCAEQQEQRRPRRNGIESLRDLPEWPAALRDAVTRYGANADHADAVGDWHATLDGKLTGATLAQLAALKGATNARKPSRRR